MRRIRAVIYGVGSVGRLTARLLLERDVEITGAIGHRNNVGRDLGEVIGGAGRLGVLIDSDADAVLRRAAADIAILTVGETVEQARPHISRCVKHGVNVLSLSEELFFPWACAPDLSRELDEFARAHGVTVAAGGMQDIFWVNLAGTLSAASQRITAIEGLGTANADDFGPVLAEEHCIGRPLKEFRDMSEGERNRRNVFTIGLEALAADLDLKIVKWTQSLEPIEAERPVHSKVLGRTIARGDVIGATTRSTVITREGILLVGMLQLRVFDESDDEFTQWRIKGEPELCLKIPQVPGRIATSTSIINRIPDILAAKPGLITVERLGRPRFHHRLSADDDSC